jgi:hypothetical protein
MAGVFEAYRKLDSDKKSDILLMLTIASTLTSKKWNILEISGFQSKPLDLVKVDHIMNTYFGVLINIYDPYRTMSILLKTRD